MVKDNFYERECPAGDAADGSEPATSECVRREPWTGQRAGDSSLLRLPVDWPGRLTRITLDLDGVPMPVYGEGAGAACSQDVRQPIGYPLIASCAETGDVISELLRDADAGPTQKAAVWIPKVVQAAREHLAPEIQVRLGGHFTDGVTLAALDAAEIPFVGRLQENALLKRLFEPSRIRGPGRPAREPREWVVEAQYQAGSWDRSRRLLIVVQEHPAERFRKAFFLVTSLPREAYSGQRVLALYRLGKGLVHIGESEDVIEGSLPQGSRFMASGTTVPACRQGAYSLRLRAGMRKVGVRLLTHSRRIMVLIECRAAEISARFLRR